MREKNIFIVSLIGFVMFIGQLLRMGAAPLGAADPPAPQAINVGTWKILPWKVWPEGKDPPLRFRTIGCHGGKSVGKRLAGQTG